MHIDIERLFYRDTDEEEERTAHSWTAWRRNSQDHGKIDHDCFHFTVFIFTCAYVAFFKQYNVAN